MLGILNSESKICEMPMHMYHADLLQYLFSLKGFPGPPYIDQLKIKKRSNNGGSDGSFFSKGYCKVKATQGMLY
jgi:hypothetical protein